MIVNTPRSLSAQRGMALLTIVILLLSIMGLGALMSLKTVTTEQRITGNDRRSRQALSVAEAGLAVGVATAIHSQPSSQISVEVTTINGQLNPGSDNVGSVVSITICPPVMGDIYRVFAVGQSDDGSAQRTVERWVAVTQSAYVIGSWRDFNVSTTC